MISTIRKLRPSVRVKLSSVTGPLTDGSSGNIVRITVRNTSTKSGSPVAYNFGLAVFAAVAGYGVLDINDQVSVGAGATVIKEYAFSIPTGKYGAGYVRATLMNTERSTSLDEVMKSFTVSQASTPTQYFISASAGVGGTISPVGTGVVTAGGSKTYTVTANSGYRISNVIVDGMSRGAISSYTFSNVTSNHSISAVFELLSATTYTITAGAGAGGRISPSGNVSVIGGTSQVFFITPNTGYQVSNVVVDGVSRGAISQYVFPTVSANHTISATFTATSAPLILSVFSDPAGQGHFTISPNKASYNRGDIVSITGYAPSGMRLSYWTTSIDNFNYAVNPIMVQFQSNSITVTAHFV